MRTLVHNIFALLEARPIVGGLEISDSALRFVASGSTFVTIVPLAPGTLQNGHPEDEAAFAKALAILREKILGRKARTSARINVVVTLSSVHIYSQVFALPYLEGGNLEKAIALNLKMALPGEAENAYAGWQTLTTGGEGNRIEVLSAFLDKNSADDLVETLRASKFSVLAIESRALSLARLTKQTSGFDVRAPLIVVSADTEGLDVVIVRGGNLQFDYFNTWKDLQGDAKEITLDAFRQMIVKNVNQILNFYNAHWKEPIAGILVSATGMREEIMATVTQNFELPAKELSPIVSPPLTPDWFTAFGAALRGRMPRKDDRELSLLGIDAREEYFEEQVDHFLGFWRILTAAALAVLLLILSGTWFLLTRLETTIQNQPILKLGPAATREIENLKNQAQTFNHQLELMQAVAAAASPKAEKLAKILDITYRHDISINHLGINGPNQPVGLSGTAKSESGIREFKSELALTPGFQNINLPLTNISKSGDTYVFSLTFEIK